MDVEFCFAHHPNYRLLSNFNMSLSNLWVGGVWLEVFLQVKMEPPAGVEPATY